MLIDHFLLSEPVLPLPLLGDWLPRLSTPVVRADHAFRGVRLGPGTHEVVFAYAPPWMPLGVAGSLCGILAVALLLAYGRSEAPAERVPGRNAGGAAQREPSGPSAVRAHRATRVLATT